METGENNQIRKDLKLTPKKNDKVMYYVKEIFSWVLVFVFAFAVAYLVNHFVIINATVPSGSMENTIMTGDRMIGNRLSYLKNDPKRGDIVIFKFPDNEKRLFVKRVIGLPGEKVVIEDGQIYIYNRQDGTEDGLYEEDYLKEEWVTNSTGYEFDIPEDGYFMMGDNRNNSNDARLWKNTYVYRDKILAKAAFVYWPFKHIGTID